MVRVKMVVLSPLKVTNRAKQKFSNNRLKIRICAKILYNCAKTGFHLRNCDPYRGWFSGNIPLIMIFITVVKYHNPKSTIEQQYCSYFSCWGQWLLTWSSFSKLWRAKLYFSCQTQLRVVVDVVLWLTWVKWLSWGYLKLSNTSTS